MLNTSKIADWWEKEKAASERILTEWVQDNPQWWAVGIAASVQTSIDLGAGLVDVLRFGEGAAEGGWRGYGKDALRLLMLLGPLGRAGGALSRFLHPLVRSGNLRLAVRVQGVSGPCTFQAVNNATSITRGRSFFVTVDDMAKAAGKNLPGLPVKEGRVQLAAWIDKLVPTLTQMGVRVKVVSGFTKVDEVVALAQRETGPVIFAFRTVVRTAGGGTREIRHSVIAMRTPGGSVQFADYGGKYFNSLKDLVSRWGAPIQDIELLQKSASGAIIDGATLTGELAVRLAAGAAVVIEGLAAIETDVNGVELAVPAAFVASSAPVLDAPVAAEVIQGSFDAFKQRKKGRQVIRLPEVVITAGRKTAPRADWLTGVQYRLNALGFGAGAVDGLMGPITRKAVVAFQRAYPPLAVDGIPGPRTQAKLCEVCGY